MLCDGEGAPQLSGGVTGGAQSRIWLLSGYRLENYFLDENVITAILAETEAEASNGARMGQEPPRRGRQA